jgi:CDP-diacylglycerol--glycerol-3-phosphate 3-phosphatidyltransferase/cardiolipin synthase
MERTAGRPLLTALPNVLTYARIAAVPALVVAMLVLDGEARAWAAGSIFVAAAITDWLDGYLARIWAQQSALGRMLDPIADKLIVGGALLMLVESGQIGGVGVIPAAIILCREILVSGLREFLASLNVQVHVTWLAKWKTVAQMVAIALLLLGPALQSVVPAVTTAALTLLWGAALLTLWTGYDYLKAAVRHAIDN